jgi:hypothetical protein
MVITVTNFINGIVSQKFDMLLLLLVDSNDNRDIFKNGLSKKGVESVELSNETNKSNFRETLPLSTASL